MSAESAKQTLHAAGRKREILAAASRVFRRKGLHATGMRDIATELGMHVGNLYYYFRNKEELLAFCQEDALAGLRALVEAARTLDVGADQRLRYLIIGHIELLNEIMPGSLAHLEVEALSETWRPKIVKLRDDYEYAVRRIIVEGVETGVFRKVDPGTTTLAILGALNWTVKWFRKDGEKTATEIGSEFADLLVGGLTLSPQPECRTH